MIQQISTAPVRQPIAYGYIRMSTLHQELSPEIQREQIEAAFKYRFEPKGYVWGGIFEDPATLGKTHFRERPAGNELYLRLQTGDAIIIQRPDRLCRKHSDQIRLIEDLCERKIMIHSTQWNLETSDGPGQFIFNIMGAYSQWENQVRSERVREAMQYLKARGQATSSHPGYGWKWEGYKRVVCERDLKIMHDVVAWVDSGWSLAVIAQHLNSHGFFNRKWKREHGRKGGMWRFEWRPWTDKQIKRVYDAELQRRADLAAGNETPESRAATMSDVDRMRAQTDGISGAETIRHESEVLRDQTADVNGRRAPLDYEQEMPVQWPRPDAADSSGT